MIEYAEKKLFTFFQFLPWQTIRFIILLSSQEQEVTTLPKFNFTYLSHGILDSFPLILKLKMIRFKLLLIL